MIVTLLAQMIPIGILSPIFFFFFYVFTPIEMVRAASFRTINKAYAAAVLPTIALAYYTPLFPCYFHPSLETRNWWNWLWQLYPVWGSIVLFLLSKIRGSKPNFPSVRATLGALATVNTAVYWYTLYASDLPLLEILVPKYLILSPQDPGVALRTIIQYDFICSFGAGYLWLAYHFWDLKAAGVCSVSWIRILGTAVVTSTIFGPGTMFLLGWSVRERFLATSTPYLRARAHKKNR